MGQILQVVTQTQVSRTFSTFYLSLNAPELDKKSITLELKRVVSLIFKHSHDFITHPLHLRLGKLNNIVTNIVDEG